MKITQEVDYAFRVIMYLSKLGLNQKIEAKTLSQQESIPHRFLLKLLRKLTQSKIICSFRGVSGGYALNMNPSEISLYDVIIAIDGPIFLNRCLNCPESCNKSNAAHCEIHKSLAIVQENLIKDLKSKTFDTFIKED